MVNVSIRSWPSYAHGDLESAYGATKAAVLELSLCQRADWASLGVGVTAICPGFINTPIVGWSARFTWRPGRTQAPGTTRCRASPRPPAGKGGRRPSSTAIATNRAVAPVGVEAVLGLVRPPAPAHFASQQALARLTGRR